MSRFMEAFTKAVITDMEDDGDRIERNYERATPEQRETMDELLICLCGYSLPRLLEEYGDDSNDDDSNDTGDDNADTDDEPRDDDYYYDRDVDHA